MCLYTDNYRAKRADRPIECYKTVNLADPVPMHKPGEVFESLYYGFSYGIGRTYTEKDFCPVTWNNLVNNGFHSFKSLDNAEEDGHINVTRPGFILKCEIPAGAWYFKGADGCDYCSDSIRVIAWKYPGPEMPWHTDNPTNMG